MKEQIKEILQEYVDRFHVNSERTISVSSAAQDIIVEKLYTLMSQGRGMIAVQKQTLSKLALTSQLGSGMEFISQIMDGMIRDVNQRKQEILIQKVQSLGIEIDLVLEAKKRFQTMSIERDGNKETYWYNDGSVEGLRIVTFVLKAKPLPSIKEGQRIDLGIEFDYY